MRRNLLLEVADVLRAGRAVARDDQLAARAFRDRDRVMRAFDGFDAAEEHEWRVGLHGRLKGVSRRLDAVRHGGPPADAGGRLVAIHAG
jgi:hypothetical protein